MSEQISYTLPKYFKYSFNCPRCGVHSQQLWTLVTNRESGNVVSELAIAYCVHCMSMESRETYSIWYFCKMIYPEDIGVAPPNSDLDEDIRKDYTEARGIVNKSPRGAAALLRLCIQKMCKQLKEDGKNLNTDIGNLVKKGLPVQIQQALDIVRVIGNNAVHPGQIDLADDQDTAMLLFRLVNRIADDRITQPRFTQELYGLLPQDARDAIEKRDQN